MPLNLVQHRGESSVWDPGRSSEWDPERWVGAAVAGVCLLCAFRRRTAAGWLLAMGGASLAWWAAAGIDERDSRRERLRLVWPIRRSRTDPVDEALEESFPASDAPSWSATAGTGDGDGSGGRAGDSPAGGAPTP